MVCGIYDAPGPKRHFVYGSTQAEVKRKLEEKKEGVSYKMGR